MTILIHIDSDADFRKKICRLLKKEDLNSRSGETIAEALELLESEKCFCIIVDTDTTDRPWQEGITLLRGVSHNLPIILTTRENSKELEAQARIEGVTYYYVKTFGEKELLKAITDIFSASQKEAPQAAADRTKILVVDDDPDFQEAIRVILESATYQVVQAYNKEDGKKKFETESPDLIILDIMMESITAGFQFLYETTGAQGKSEPHTPVLSVTSISQERGFNFSPTKDGDFFPADDYLAKPVKSEDLLEHVAALLGKNTQKVK